MIPILNDSRCISDFEQTLYRGTTAPYTKERKEDIESNLLRIQQTFGAIPALSSLLDEDPAVPRDTPTTPAESGSPSALGDFACRRLIRRTFSPHELPSLLEALLSGDDGNRTIYQLSASDAQALLDVVEEVCLSSQACWMKLISVCPVDRHRTHAIFHRRHESNVLC